MVRPTGRPKCAEERRLLMSTDVGTFTLANGVAIPQVGFGTWQIPPGDAAYEATRVALDAGYRHIDTALAYGNEASVGQAIRDSGLDRDDVFVTTKLPGEVKTAAGAREAFETSARNLGLGNIDLYLVHAPWPWDEVGADYSAQNVEVWRVLEDFYHSGQARAIGVSNFTVADLEALTAETSVLPAANQIRWFIGNTQPATTAWCQERGVVVEGYSPLATGGLLDNAQLCEIAERHGRSAAQVALRYLLQKNVLPLPKSTTPARIRQNLELDFVLGSDDLAALDALAPTGPAGPFNS